ncbi:MAG: DNA translocase FtsK 4TM domain-containing protein, partial [Siculibacillus sp.]
MRSARPASPTYAAGSDLRRVLARNLRGVGGIATFAAVAAVAAALATWSATDPSLSNATSTAVHNALGSPGAVVADLAMQLLGLASALALPPLLVIGWRLVSAAEGGFDRRFATWWLVALFAAAGALATLPTGAGWPLPIGLGGVAGDMLARLPLRLLGDGDLARLAAGLAFAGLALWADLRALGWIGPDPEPESADDWDEDDAWEREGRDRLMPFAVLHHAYLVARANVLRLFGVRSSSLDTRRYGFSLRRLIDRLRRPSREWNDDAWSEPPRPSVGLRSRAEPSRIEPDFGAARTPARGPTARRS